MLLNLRLMPSALDIQKQLNRILERDHSAYRLAGKHLVQITSEHEIAAVEAAT